jgi:hypothetical protein
VKSVNEKVEVEAEVVAVGALPDKNQDLFYPRETAPL